MVLWVYSAPGSKIISKGRTGPHEYIVLQHQSIPQINSTLECHAAANSNSPLHESVVANIAVIANDGSLKNMGKSPDTGSSPYDRAIFYDDFRM